MPKLKQTEVWYEEIPLTLSKTQHADVLNALNDLKCSSHFFHHPIRTLCTKKLNIITFEKFKYVAINQHCINSDGKGFNAVDVHIEK